MDQSKPIPPENSSSTILAPPLALSETPKFHSATYKRGGVEECNNGIDSIRPAPTPYSGGMEFSLPVPITELGEEEDIPWLWYGYLARLHVTLLTGLWKSGKSTLLANLLQSASSGGDLGGAVQPCRVLVITEETKTMWARRRGTYNLGPHVHIWTRPIRGRANMTAWIKFLTATALLIRERKYDVVVFDTLTYFWPVTDENDATRVTDALHPLHLLTAEGAAVLLMHHPRKSNGEGGGNESECSRGSGALPGFADVLMYFGRMPSASREDRRRVISGYARFDETPQRQVFEYEPDGNRYRGAGSLEAAREHDRLDVIDSILPPTPGWTWQEVVTNWPPHLAKPGVSTVKADLAKGVQDKRWNAEGKGVKNDARKFFKGESETDIPFDPDPIPEP